jgi:hemerythrin-like metal-binding protein
MMKILDYKTTFQGGIRRLDAEHRKQVDLIQRFGEREATMIELLGNLYASYSKQFAYEEAIMRARCYDGYEAHQADHQRLLDEITMAMFHYRSGARHDSAKVAKNLAESFRDHLLIYDQCFPGQTDMVTQVV